jgi:cyclic-di-AMP phosphodiesterase PgpH
VGNLAQDGQLDDCDLTFRDLELLRRQFTRVLVGMYHQRVDYPLMVNGKLLEETCPGDKKPAKERKH